MNAAWVVGGALVVYYLGYRFYSTYLVSQVFQLKPGSRTPAHLKKDGIDFVPTSSAVLLGHHYSSIAGAAPIVGPAVAVIWGWVPAVIWVVLGTLFMGAVHDMGALIVSMKNEGQSIGQVSEKLLGARARTLFLVVIFFLVWMVLAVFALVITNLFISFPSSVLPVNFQIIVALLIGWFVNRRGKKITMPTLFAVIALLGMIFVGTQHPISLRSWAGESEAMVWILFLMVYSYVASILPVWSLLQPRDYINSFQLFGGLGLLVVGLFVTQPQIVAPALQLSPPGAPPLFPFLFITIACGAVSGFHSLVSSGTTSKQVANWKDCRPIGYGAMLGEGLLALLATLAATAGFSSLSEWNHHYSSWQAANGLGAKISAFVLGSSRFLGGLGLPQEYSQTVIAVMVISFAATSLDTAARIQRYIISELGGALEIKLLSNRHVSGLLAVGTALGLMLVKGGGKGGLLIWPLFGATNQMLAALTLTVVAVFLIKNKRPAASFLIPACFLAVLTAGGLVLNIYQYALKGDWILSMIGVILLSVQFWILFESVRFFRSAYRK